jgi:hypothetical protein
MKDVHHFVEDDKVEPVIEGHGLHPMHRGEGPHHNARVWDDTGGA